MLATLSAAACTTAPPAPSTTTPAVTRAAQTETGANTNEEAQYRTPASDPALQPYLALGFSSSVASKVMNMSPNFFELLDARIAQNLKTNPKFYKQFPDTKKVIHFYRGIHVDSVANYDPNYRLFVSDPEFPNAKCIGSIDLISDKAMAERHAYKVHDGQKAFLIELEIPLAVVGPGTLAGPHYRLGTCDLTDVGISNLTAFEVSVTPLPATPAPQKIKAK